MGVERWEGGIRTLVKRHGRSRCYAAPVFTSSQGNLGFLAARSDRDMAESELRRSGSVVSIRYWELSLTEESEVGEKPVKPDRTQ